MKLSTKMKNDAVNQSIRSIKSELIEWANGEFRTRGERARDSLSRITGTMLFLEESLGEEKTLETAWEGRK